MTDDLILKLMAAGLSKQQATSITVETLVHLFMKDDGKILIREAEQQVTEMKKMVIDLKAKYNNIMERMTSVSDLLCSVNEAQKEHGYITDEKAKNVIALYASILAMNEKAGAEASDSIRNAGYILYAYLGGQAMLGLKNFQRQKQDGEQ